MLKGLRWLLLLYSCQWQSLDRLTHMASDTASRPTPLEAQSANGFAHHALLRRCLSLKDSRTLDLPQKGHQGLCDSHD